MLRFTRGRLLTSLVSMRYAPSFVQPPAEEVIGKSVKNIPENYVTAYVLPDMITEAEERALLQFVHPWFEKLEFNDGHIDGLIHHYMEFYRSYSEILSLVDPAHAPQPQPSGASDTAVAMPTPDVHADLKSVQAALTRLHAKAAEYLPQIPIDDRVHFLRLAGSGFIRGHVDETRNSSGIIAGCCLGSGRVMTLTHPAHPGERVELMLAPRCMYLIIGRARYDWEHSVDWVRDDDEHIKRINKSLVAEGTPVVFDGRETEFRRFDRTAIIFRGVSPMHLFAQRMQQQQHKK